MLFQGNSSFNKLKRSLFLVLLVFISACKKGPGEGGNSSIAGTVHVTRYDANFINIQGAYNVSDEWVYIIYGDDVSYGERTLTGPDGKFEFKYLRKGNYTVYVYSEDASVSGQQAVSRPIEISESNQTVDAGIFEIKKN